MDKSRRILVLGSAPHTHLVRAHNWDNLPGNLNVADYDVVILNLFPFSVDKCLAKGVNLATLPSQEQFSRLLFSPGSEIVAIGCPRVRLGSKRERTTTWWLPSRVPFRGELIAEIRCVHPDVEYYFKYVDKCVGWHPSQKFDRIINEKNYLEMVHPQADFITCDMVPIAQTRFKEPLAFWLHYEIWQVLESSPCPTQPARKQLKVSGPVIWLPPTTRISACEAVDLILRERYGLSFETAPPEWLEAYRLPNQVPVERGIKCYEKEIEKLEQELASLQQQLEQEARFRKMLYEQREDVLEPVVRDALRELAPNPEHVVDPEQRGREDGRVVDLHTAKTACWRSRAAQGRCSCRMCASWRTG